MTHHGVIDAPGGDLLILAVVTFNRSIMDLLVEDSSLDFSAVPNGTQLGPSDPPELQPIRPRFVRALTNSRRPTHRGQNHPIGV